MKITYKGSLQRTMVVYFLLIGFASSLIVTEFIIDVQREELRSEMVQNCEKLSAHLIQPDEALHPIQRIRNKAILMISLLLVVVGILLTMFIKNIAEPLQHMIGITKLIATGDLSQTVNIRARNELAEMGNTVNELTSNLQEMMLLSKDMCAGVDRFIEDASHALNTQDADQARISDLRREMHLLHSKAGFLNSIILNCRFYKIGR